MTDISLLSISTLPLVTIILLYVYEIFFQILHVNEFIRYLFVCLFVCFISPNVFKSTRACLPLVVLWAMCYNSFAKSSLKGVSVWVWVWSHDFGSNLFLLCFLSYCLTALQSYIALWPARGTLTWGVGVKTLWC